MIPQKPWFFFDALVVFIVILLGEVLNMIRIRGTPWLVESNKLFLYV